MTEVITLGIGGAGVSVCHNLWDYYIQERDNNQEYEKYNQAVNFHEDSAGSYVPRGLFIDTDPTGTDLVQESAIQHWFNDDHYSTGSDGTGTNYGEGRYTSGREQMPETQDKLRKQAESCDSSPIVFIIGSISGGTGSGLSGLICEDLYDEFNIIKYNIYQPPTSLSTPNECFNTMYSTRFCQEYARFSVNVDNDQCVDILNRLGISDPTYDDINSLLSSNISMIASMNRFGHSKSYFSSLEASLISYPCINFLTPSFAPWGVIPKVPNQFPTLNEITEDLFRCSNSLITTSQQEDQIIAANITCFGDVHQEDLISAVEHSQKSDLNTFCDFTNTAMEVNKAELGEGCTRFSNKVTDTLYNMKRYACMLLNSCRTAEVLKRVATAFDKLCKPRAYFHTYLGLGFGEGEFSENRESFAWMLQDYFELNAKYPPHEFIEE
ncbi:unnamed protein product [Moneuplotes crassus]|uniref:Tubulin/FtsZ GTPase domain-containing protein n=1 Tax=Euplotes crassus TaxID=5936 RepID=A0AAD1U523_EUPCR|nr:unnamed protein product [Moneuplotes crassus]